MRDTPVPPPSLVTVRCATWAGPSATHAVPHPGARGAATSACRPSVRCPRWVAGAAGNRPGAAARAGAAGPQHHSNSTDRALKASRLGHGAGTVAKALAELTAAGELVNRRDKRGYRLPEWWKRVETPSLFE